MRTAAVAAALALGCSSAASPVVSPPADAVDAAIDAGPALDVAPDAPEVAAPAPRCTDPVELVAGRVWSVSPAADGVAPACSGAGNVGRVAWARVEVPARSVLRLRVPGTSGAGGAVWIYGDCPSTACLPGVGSTVDGVDDRRFFNDGAAPRTVWIAATAGLTVLPEFAPAPNLRCADATAVEPGAVVDADPFPAVEAAPACPRSQPIAAPARWYRVRVPGERFGGATLVLSAPDMEFQLYSGCDPARCLASSYLAPYSSDARYVVRWTNATGADATVYVAVSRAPGVAAGPFGFRLGLEGHEEGVLCGASIPAPTSYDRHHFTTRWGADRRAVCGDSLGRSTPVRWFEVNLRPGESMLANAFEGSSIARPVWQLFESCESTRCLATSSTNVFANALEHTNATADVESFRLALGNLAAEHLDDLDVRVRTFRAAPNDRCETARRVAPNTALTGEDLTAGRTGPPPCSVGTRERRALWYVTRVDPGRRFEARVANATTAGAALTVQASCADACGIFDVNRGPGPVDVHYSVSQDTVPGLYATYDLVALSPLAD